VSKRSYRRLALVAGAALAVGAVAPAAMASVSINADGTSAATVGLTLPTLPSLTDLPGVGMGAVSTVNDLALGDVVGIANVLNLSGLSANVLNAADSNLGNVIAAVNANAANVFANVGGVANNLTVASVGNVLSDNTIGGILGGSAGDALPVGSLLNDSLLSGGLSGILNGSLQGIVAANVVGSF